MNVWLEPLVSNAVVATLLAVVAAGAAMLRPHPAALHALWLIVLLKFITPPLLSIDAPTGFFTAASSLQGYTELAADPFPDGAAVTANLDDLPLSPTGENSFAATERTEAILPASDAPLPETSNSSPLGSWLTAWLPSALAGVWIAGSAAWFALAAIRLARFYRHLARTQTADEVLQQTAAEVARRLQLRNPPRVRITYATLPPLLVSFGARSLIVLPHELLQGLSRSQQAAILAHELAHFRRGDHWTRWLEVLVLGLYWWHPAAWWACRRLRQAEELCCDAWVVRVFPDQAKGYAQALLATVDFLSEVRTPAPAGACGFGAVPPLQRRLEMILKRTSRPDLPSLGRLAVLAVALGVLPWTPRAFSQGAEPGDKSSAPPTAANDLRDGKPSTEERLDRLEKMLQQLLDKSQSPFKGEDKSDDQLKARVQAKQELVTLDQQIEALEAQLAALRMHRQALHDKLLLTSEKGAFKADKSLGHDSKNIPALSKIPYVDKFFHAKSPLGLKLGSDAEGKTLQATDSKTGKIVWEVDIQDLGAVQAVQMTGDTLTLIGENKRQIVIDAKTGKIVASSAGKEKATDSEPRLK